VTRRVCIVTPGQLGSSPRVVKEAQALREAGYDVHVIATRMLDRIEARDRDVLAAASWRAERIDARSRARWRWRRARQTMARVLFRSSGRETLAGAALSPLSGDLSARAARVPADLYIAHYVAALPAVARAARRHGARYAFDAEDFHPGDLPDLPEHEFEKRLIRAVEGRYLPRCAYMTAASPGIAEAYTEAYGVPRPAVVLNVFPLAHAPAPAAPRGTAAPGPSLYWFSQTIGPDRGLECAARAIGLARARPHLYLRGTLASGFAGRLQELAGRAGAADRLHILPPEAPSKMERLAACYDLGLAGETGHTPNRRIALTNKQFTYLLAGVPAVMSDIPAHRAIASEAGLAMRLYRTDDPAALADALDALLLDPATLAKARAAAWRLGRERYNWDLEKSKLLAAVGAAIGCPSTRAAQCPVPGEEAVP